jgi:hypothetical protein
MVSADTGDLTQETLLDLRKASNVGWMYSSFVNHGTAWITLSGPIAKQCLKQLEFQGFLPLFHSCAKPWFPSKLRCPCRSLDRNMVAQLAKHL